MTNKQGRIFVIGDLHGSAAGFNYLVDKYINNPTAEDIIICAGDVGLEYGPQIQGALKKAMKKFPGKIYVMRGNHDNRYWRDHTKVNQENLIVPMPNWHYDNPQYPMFLIQDKYPNIYYIRDEGGIYNIEGKTFLFIPGAYSIDKDYRLSRNLSYEYEEQLSLVEQHKIYCTVEQFLNDGGRIDYVISHTSPLGLEPYYKDLFLSGINQSTVNKSTEYFLDEIEKLLHNNYKHWYFGHFHDDRSFGKFTMLYSKVVELGETVNGG